MLERRPRRESTPTDQSGPWSAASSAAESGWASTIRYCMIMCFYAFLVTGVGVGLRVGGSLLLDVLGTFLYLDGS